MRAHWPTLAALVLAGGLSLTGCSDDDAGPLGEDDLPATVVESDTGHAGLAAVGSCEALNTAQEQLTTSADVEDGYRYWTYDLEDGTFVGVSVVEPDYPFADVSAALASVEEAAAECADVEPLGELPDDAIGFASVTTSSNGERTGTTLLAPVGDDRVVTVAVSGAPGADPSVDAEALLADLRERAADLDLG